MNKKDIDKFLTTVIEPNKQYVVQVHKESLTMKDAAYLAKEIDRMDSKGCVVLYDEKPVDITEEA